MKDNTKPADGSAVEVKKTARKPRQPRVQPVAEVKPVEKPKAVKKPRAPKAVATETKAVETKVEQAVWPFPMTPPVEGEAKVASTQPVSAPVETPVVTEVKTELVSHKHCDEGDCGTAGCPDCQTSEIKHKTGLFGWFKKLFS